MGAWIETEINEMYPDAFEVAPYVGAWIEAMNQIIVLFMAMSHLTWVRGLKQFGPYNKDRINKSHLTWVRGLKHKPALDGIGYQGRTLRGCVD